MTEPNLSFAKVVANPNVFSWSQVYNKGKLFAVLSLATKQESTEKDYLNVLGKEVFNVLEQEYFTLESKDLESIKTAVLATSEKIPQEVSCSFVVASVVNNILYVYVLGDGRASLKRGEKLGNLLEEIDQEHNSLKVASGFLEDDDMIILQTKQFAQSISTDVLSEFVGNMPVSDAAENLAPLIHEKEETAASAILALYKVPAKQEETFVTPETAIQDSDENIPDTPPILEEPPFYTPEITDDYNPDNKKNFLESFIARFKNLRPTGKISLNHPRKIILIVIVVILIVFLGSVFFAINKQQDEKTKSLYASIYPAAEKKYEEGQGLVDLNQALARDSFESAKKILEKGNDKFPKNSTYEKQITTLLAKINSALGDTPVPTESSAKPVNSNLNPMLSLEIKNNGLYFTKDDSNIYFITSSAIFSLDKDGTNKKSIITNDSDWETPGGFATYFDNIYVLDKGSQQIYKFVPSGSNFEKADYFTSKNEGLSKAVSMAIDSSIYILYSDGNIAKFTRGSVDDFSFLGLDKNLSKPTRIITDADMDNIYVLDNGNSRIVVLDKTGKYKKSYLSPVIKQAKDFDVLEAEKKIYILSGEKIYEINL